MEAAVSCIRVAVFQIPTDIDNLLPKEQLHASH